MTPEEYQKVKAVFQSVMEIEPLKRAEFLDNLCANDADLRLEVEKLLNNYESGFMEETAIQNVADLIVNEESLVSGEKIGRFEIISRLGKGGMGEVYLAHDKSLNRDVAIKVLLPEFSSDRERVNRFKLEAKAASALNHPNIITIYEVGEDNGKLFIATEHIKGETLRTLIQEQKIDLASSIRIAEQVASALTAAHHAGIIHRDIKPENIMVREDGFVKVLDFGLAKPTIVNPETETMDLVETKKGMIMGSVGYMSPEQARGKEVDARTDLWSIGVVFYEMLTGKTPFQGDTMTDILANIIHKEPSPISEQLPNNPTELYRIVKKSLRKNADERYQTARDLSSDIKNLRREMELEHELELSVSPERLQEIRSKSNDIQKTVDEDKATKILSNPLITETSVEIARVKSRYRTAILATIGILLIGTLGYFGYSYLKPKRLVETAFKNKVIEKLPISKIISSIAISPDGKYLAYIEGKYGKNGRLILRHVETGSETEILAAKDSQIGLKSFSADGNYLYYHYVVFSNGNYGLRRVPLFGGDTKEIDNEFDSIPSFSSDGTKMVFNRATPDTKAEQIIVSDSDGQNESVIFSNSDYYVLDPRFSPDGSKILFAYGDKTKQIGVSAKIGWIPASGGEINSVGNAEWNLIGWGAVYNANFAWLKDGSGVLIANKKLPETTPQIFTLGFPDGEVKPLTDDASGYENISITTDNRILGALKHTTVSGIWEYDLQTGKSTQVTPSTELLSGRYGVVEASHNILFTKSNGKDSRDLWSINKGSSEEKLIVSQKGNIEFPIITSNGRTVLFTTNSQFGISSVFQINAIWSVDIDGSNLKQIKSPAEETQQLIALSSDEKYLVFREWAGNWADPKIKSLNLLTGEITTILNDSKSNLGRIAISTDGKKVIYHSTVKQKGKNGILDSKSYIVDFNGAKFGETSFSIPGNTDLWASRFAPDNKSIYYFDWGNNADIWQFDFATQKSTKITNFNHDQIYNFTISRDGKKLYLVRGNTTDEVVLIKNVE